MKRVILESFPRSGSTYCTALVYAMYKCKVYGSALPYREPERKFPFEEPSFALRKEHRPDAEPSLANQEVSPFDEEDFDKLICVVRSPLEAITRHNDWDTKLDICRGNKWKCEKTSEFVKHYEQILHDYREKFDQAHKSLVYYEEMMGDLGGALQEIKNLLGPEENLTISQISDNLPKIKKWSASGHKFLDNKSEDESDSSFDPYKHQRGMPLEMFEYYRSALKDEYDEIVGHYFEEGPVYKRWEEEQ